jgi:hypothetical protein
LTTSSAVNIGGIPLSSPANLLRTSGEGHGEGRQCGNSCDGGQQRAKKVPPGEHTHWINRGLRV